MRRGQKRARSWPIRRLVLFGLFVVAQLLLLSWYMQNRDWFVQLSPQIISEVYVPSLRQAWKGEEPPVSNGNANSVPVLVYHGVVEKADGTNTPMVDFSDQMFTLYKAGWKAVAFEDFQAYMDGQKQLPDKSFLLTFDDGRKDSYYPVDPILRVLGYKATMFVITEHVIRNNHSTNYLNRDELQKMKNSGRWSLQAHTKNGHDLLKVSDDGKKGHFFSNLLWIEDENRLETQDEFRKRVRDDLFNIKTDMQKEFGIEPTAFAFPFGDYGQQTINNPEAEAYIISQARSLYKYAFVQEQSNAARFMHSIPGRSPLNLQRIQIYPGWTGANIIKIMSVGGAKQLPYYTTFADTEGWSTQHGDISLDGLTGMRMAPSKGGRGAGASLEGSDIWSDLKSYKAVLEWRAGSNVLLMARYKDSRHYIACNFGVSSTKIQQTIDGTKTTPGSSGPGIVTLGRVELEMIIEGSDISCLANGKELTSADSVTWVESGRIGIEIWDPQPDKSLIYLERVEAAKNKLSL